MATGTTVHIGNSWTQLTDDAEDFVIQNVGNDTAFIKYAATIPAAGDTGHICEIGDGVTSAAFGQGITWGKSPDRTTVEVTK